MTLEKAITMAEAKPDLLYEIINPSDAVTVVAPSFAAAAIAIIMVGGGQYAGKPIGHDAGEVPLFLFGGFEEWLQKTFPGREIGELLNEHRADVITTLRSACTGSANDRLFFDKALAAITDDEKRKTFIAEWDDAQRTSMNQIANRAHSMADHMAKNREKEAA